MVKRGFGSEERDLQSVTLSESFLHSIPFLLKKCDMNMNSRPRKLCYAHDSCMYDFDLKSESFYILLFLPNEYMIYL